jgi:galactose mutarotase-like enzyme
MHIFLKIETDIDFILYKKKAVVQQYPSKRGVEIPCLCPKYNRLKDNVFEPAGKYMEMNAGGTMSIKTEFDVAECSSPRCRSVRVMANKQRYLYHAECHIGFRRQGCRVGVSFN